MRDSLMTMRSSSSGYWLEHFQSFGCPEKQFGTFYFARRKKFSHAAALRISSKESSSFFPGYRRGCSGCDREVGSILFHFFPCCHLCSRYGSPPPDGQ